MAAPTTTYQMWKRLAGRPGGTRLFSTAAMVRVPYFASIVPHVVRMEPGLAEVTVPKWFFVTAWVIVTTVADTLPTLDSRTPGYRSELTDLRVLLTLSRSVFRDLTVPRCPLSVFFSCLSDFLCRFTALRRVSSRRSTVRNTFCAAVALAAGEVADRLPLALRLAVAVLAVDVLAVRDRVLGRVLVAFFFEVAAEAVRRRSVSLCCCCELTLWTWWP